MSKLGINVLPNNQLTSDQRKKLFNENIGLIFYVMKKYRISKNSSYYEDLLQEGYMGLMRATELFIPEYGYAFSTYAVYWIRAKIFRHLRYEKKINFFPMDSRDYLLLPTVSLDFVLHKNTKDSGSNNKERKIIDTLGSDPINDDEIDFSDKINMIYEKINTIFIDLSNQGKYKLAWQYAIILHYRLLSSDPMSLEDLGKLMNFSRERVRQLESKLFELLYHSIHLGHYRSDLPEKEKIKKKKSLFGVSAKNPS